MDVREYVLDELQREYTFKKDADVDEINYIEEGYMDSLGLVQFIVSIEDTFQIEFSETEIDSPAFRKVGTLVELIEKKILANGGKTE